MKSELDFFLDEFKYIDINSFIGTLELDKNKEQHIGRLTKFIADKIDDIILTKNNNLLEKFTNIILGDELSQNPAESTSEIIIHLVAKAAYKYYCNNQEFKNTVNEYIHSDSDNNSEPNNGHINITVIIKNLKTLLMNIFTQIVTIILNLTMGILIKYLNI